jgi:hypothetical protein
MAFWAANFESNPVVNSATTCALAASIDATDTWDHPLAQHVFSVACPNSAGKC